MFWIFLHIAVLAETTVIKLTI